jgi:hypothetical protein
MLRSSRANFCLALLTAIVMTPSLSGPASGCATAHRPEDRVRIAEESAIIIWDSGSKMQHFIRRASFVTGTKDFGFLVPTPSQPSLGEARDAAFSYLEKVTAPAVEKVRQYELNPPFFLAGAKVAAPNASVAVLDRQRVAGYDAVVLEASSARALTDWLKKNGYTTRPDLEAWLKTYVEARWKITAFKIAKDAGQEAVGTQAVRMSFTAERPFFPYSEPAEQRSSKGQKDPSESRLLRVFFLADQRYAGKLEDGGEWPGKTVWAAPLPATVTQELTEHVSPTVVPEGIWLTTFEDSSSPRPGTADLYFSPALSQEKVHRPPVVYVEHYDLTGWVCLGVVVLLALALGIFVWKRWSKSALPSGLPRA